MGWLAGQAWIIKSVSDLDKVLIEQFMILVIVPFLQDVFYSNRTFQNGDEIRELYCLHAVNHILK